jgi:hypothetical protein
MQNHLDLNPQWAEAVSVLLFGRPKFSIVLVCCPVCWLLAFNSVPKIYASITRQ